MLNRVTRRFLGALKPVSRDEAEHSVYDRAANMTSAVLVVDEDADATPLLKACFEHRFPVAVDLVRNDRFVPRIETLSHTIVGEPDIRCFLESRT